MNKLRTRAELTSLEQQPSRSPDLLVLVRALWAGKWKIAAAVALALVLAAAHLATTEPTYVATTVLSLERQEREVVKDGSGGDGPATEEKKLTTEAAVLRSRGLVEQLVEELSLLDDPEFNPTLQLPEFPSLGWARLQADELMGVSRAALDEQIVLSATVLRTLSAIAVHAIPNTYLIEVQVRSGSPVRAAEIANTLAQLYLDARRNAQSRIDDQQIYWLSEEVERLRSALEAIERSQKDFGVWSEVVSQRVLDAEHERLKGLRERLLRNRHQVSESQSRVGLLERLLGDATPEDIAAGSADPLLSAAVRLDGVGAEPQVDNGRALALLAAARAETDRQARLAGTIEAAITDLEARIERQSSELIQARQIAREVEASRTIYEFALNRLKELSVQRAIEHSGAHVLSPAEAPLSPSGPRDSVVLALAAALGTFIGAGLILIRQGVQDRFRTAEEVESVSGIPVIGQIPALPTRNRRKVMEHIVAGDSSSFSEAVRNLRASISSMSRKQPSVLMLSSAVPGEGKSTLALALAHSLAAVGKRVLLIDADMRRLNKAFPGAGNVEGLAAAIAEGKPLSELVKTSEEFGIDILFSGWTSRNAADLFSSQNFVKVLTDAKSIYEMIIIDTPPTLVVSDAKLIAQRADMVLLAVRWNATSRSQFTETVREFLMADAVVNGCVLSQMDPKGMARLGFGDRRGLMAGYSGRYYRR